MKHQSFSNNILILLSLFSIFSCGRAPQKSGLDTVEVSQTDVRDQQNVGFCWAYATTALIESQYKVRTGKDIHLSPEAIGFYRMAIGIFNVTRAKSIRDIMPLLLPGALEGYFVKQKDGGGDALELVQRYGVVQKSDWSFEFDTPEKSQKLMREVQGKLWVLLRNELLKGRDASNITLEDIMDKVMVGGDAFPSRPPSHVSFEGQSIPAVQFLNEVLGFIPDQYIALEVQNSDDYTAFIQSIKRALAMGVSVPLAFPVNFDQMVLERFTGFGSDDSTDFAKDGAHAVLITDWVNYGGHEGAMTRDEIIAETSKSPDELDYFVFKNSWGKFAKKNESGVVIAGSESGYYKIDRLYLEGTSRQVLRDQSLKPLFSVLLPKTIVENLNGDITIHPQVEKK